MGISCHAFCLSPLLRGLAPRAPIRCACVLSGRCFNVIGQAFAETVLTPREEIRRACVVPIRRAAACELVLVNAVNLQTVRAIRAELVLPGFAVVVQNILSHLLDSQRKKQNKNVAKNRRCDGAQQDVYDSL